MAMLLESLRARAIHRGAENFRNYAQLAAGYQGRNWSSKGTNNQVQRMPAGPAVMITPSNPPPGSSPRGSWRRRWLQAIR